MTFNNVLENVDNTYFWFSSKEDGLACVRQDRVNFMYCTDSLKKPKTIRLYNGYKIDDMNDYCSYLIKNKQYDVSDAIYEICQRYGIKYNHKIVPFLENLKENHTNKIVSHYLKNLNLVQYSCKDNNSKPPEIW